MPRSYRTAILFALAGCVSLVCAYQTKADTTTISNPNSALSCCTGPYATVDITLNAAGTIATVTFTSATNGGYIYLMGDGGTADLNVNGLYTLGAVTETNSIAGFTPTFLSNTPGQVDGFGTFNLSLNNTDGFTDSATSISFTLTKVSGTWSSAANVLTPNSGGSDVAIHAFACATSTTTPCTTATGAFATGFAANGSQVPEPVSMLLFGSGLVAIGAKLRHRKSRKLVTV